MKSELTDAELAELVPESDSGPLSADRILAMAAFDAIAKDEPNAIQKTEKALRNARDLAKGMDRLAIAALREILINRLEALGLSSPARLVNAALSGMGNGDESQRAQGSEVLFSDPELSPDPVDTGKLLDLLTAHFRKYVILPKHGAETMSLYTVLTHVFNEFNVLPTLAFTSPEKRCGKTVAAEAMAGVVWRPLSTASVSPAALFRIIERHSPTMLIDEADTFLVGNDELRGILNAGHRRTAAFVIRTVGDDFEPRKFSTWAPKILALIGELPDTQQDRTIEISMRRKEPAARIARFNLEKVRKETEQLRRKLARFAKDASDRLKNSDPPMPEELNDRAQDNWRGLIAIADLAGGDWPEKARNAAIALSGDSDHAGGSSYRTQLLHDLKALFEDRGTESLASE